MVKIFISYDFEGEPTSLLMSDDRMKVDIALNAMDIPAHSVEEIEITSEAFGLHNLAFILTSQEVQGMGKPFRVWRRGR